MKTSFFLFVFFFLANCLFAQQTVQYHLTSDTTVQLVVGGKLDRNNSVGGKVSYFWDLYQYYKPGFEPLERLTLTNNGENTVEDIRMIFNDQREWYADTAISNELLSGNLTEKQKALLRWKLIHDNHVYFYKAENIISPESNDLVKFFTVYGIADCYMSNVNLWLLNNLVNNPDSSFYWGLNYGDHGVTEVKVDSSYAVFDADQNAFYLQLDNENLAGYDDIRMDEYLYIRTKRWAPLVPFYSPKNYVDVANFQSPGNYRTRFGEYPVFRSTSSIVLRPQETIEFYSDSSKSYHQLIFQDNGERPADSDVLSFIGNGLINYKPTPKALQSYQQEQEGSASIIIPVTSPFVITSGQLSGSVAIPQSTKFSIGYSTDQNEWESLFSTAEPRTTDLSLSLDTVISTFIKPAVYNYFVRLTWEGANIQNVSGLIDSLTLSSRFQISMFYFPKLIRGENSIRVESNETTGKDLQLNVVWKESSENNPPAIADEPIYPEDKTVVNAFDITFQWADALDSDNDEIVDYQFQLSDDSLMRYPLATNFDVSLRNIDSILKPEFHSSISDFLLPGKTYYWRVRALDSRNAWSEWSRVWQFECNGPKQPLNLRVDTVANGYVLKWDRPENDNAAYFKIFAFIKRGFFPTFATYYDSCSTNEYFIPFDKKIYPFYRVASVDEHGNESTTTKAVYIRDSIVLKAGQNYTLDSLSDNGYLLSYSTNTSDIITLNGRVINGKKEGKAIVFIHYINDVGRTIQTDQVVVMVRQGSLYFKPVSAERKYGEDEPIFSFTVTGFDSADNETALDSLPFIVTDAQKYSPAGTYTLSLSGGGDKYYKYVFDTASLTVMKNYLKVVGDTIQITAGDPLPTLTYKIEGLLGSDKISDIDELPVAQVDAGVSNYSGNYRITLSGGYDNNYELELKDGMLTVTPSTFLLYPNPTNGLLSIKIGEELLGKTLRIFRTKGKVIYTSQLYNIETRINLTNQPRGVYFFQIFDGSAVLRSGKFVIQ